MENYFFVLETIAYIINATIANTTTPRIIVIYSKYK